MDSLAQLLGSSTAADDPAALIARMQALLMAAPTKKPEHHGVCPLCQEDFTGTEPVQACNCGCLYHDGCIKVLAKKSGKPILDACCIPHEFDRTVEIPPDVTAIDVDADAGEITIQVTSESRDTGGTGSSTDPLVTVDGPSQLVTVVEAPLQDTAIDETQSPQPEAVVETQQPSLQQSQVAQIESKRKAALERRMKKQAATLPFQIADVDVPSLPTEDVSAETSENNITPVVATGSIDGDILSTPESATAEQVNAAMVAIQAQLSG